MSGVYQKVWGKLFLGESFKIFNRLISYFRILNLAYDLDCPTLFDGLHPKSPKEIKKSIQLFEVLRGD